MRLDRVADADRGNNNFDLLRLGGAILVLFAHSFDLVGAPEPFPSLGPNMNWGFVGVLIFFSISGFLVSRSWARSPRLIPFAVKRALRLMPALIVALLLTALVLGPLVTALSAHAYLGNPETKAYILDNATMQSNYYLPGVFLHNAYPNAVNGSLWTLPLEVKAYVFVALIGMLGLLRRFKLALVGIAGLIVLSCIDGFRSLVPATNHFVAGLVNVQLPAQLVQQAQAGTYNVFTEVFAAFAVGAALYALRKWVILRWELALAAVAAWLGTIALGATATEVGAVVLAPYVVLCLAYGTHAYVRLPSRIGDYSYGAYVYGFPVQQTISFLMYPIGGWLMFALATPLTMLLAIASWHVVERPALNIKHRLTGTESPAGMPTTSLSRTHRLRFRGLPGMSSSANPAAQ